MKNLSGNNIKGTRGYHYSHPGQRPGNILNMVRKERVKVNASMGRRLNDLMIRAQLEKTLSGLAKKLVKGKPIIDHPLYFRMDKSRKWGDDKIRKQDTYEIDPRLLEGATYMGGDSYSALQGIIKDKWTTLKKSDLSSKKLADVYGKLLMNYKDMSAKGLDDIKFIHGLGPRTYIEGHVWQPWEVKGNRIVPKSIEKSAALSRHEAGTNKDRLSKVADAAARARRMGYYLDTNNGAAGRIQSLLSKLGI